MATSNPNENTATDLSSLCDGLVAHSSMSAVNGISEVPGFRGPGSTSEASEGVTPGDPSVDEGTATSYVHGPRTV